MARQAKKAAGRKNGSRPEPKVVRKVTALKIASSGSHAKGTVVTPSRSLTFGSVMIESLGDVAPAERNKNIHAGQEALKRAKTALTRSGVTLDLKAHIPKYHVDGEGRLVRVLGPKKQIGKLVNGDFVAAD